MCGFRVPYEPVDSDSEDDEDVSPSFPLPPRTPTSQSQGPLPSLPHPSPSYLTKAPRSRAMFSGEDAPPAPAMRGPSRVANDSCALIIFVWCRALQTPWSGALVQTT